MTRIIRKTPPRDADKKSYLFFKGECMDRIDHDDFMKVLTKEGFSENDFEINEVDLTHWIPNAIVKIEGTITLKLKSTQKEKMYKTGWGTHWVYDFEIDLKKGIFNHR